MDIVQLGLFRSVYNWVYDKILDPLWDWVSGLLSSGFKYLANIVPNVIGTVMDTLFGKVIDVILEWYFSRWFVIQSAILLLLDCIEDCFNVVSGLSPVYVKGSAGAGQGEPVSMLIAVFRQGTVQRAFLTMIVVGFSICFAMAIIATARSFFELGSEKTKPVTHTIRMTAKSLLYLALAPMLAAGLILLSQAILKTIDRAVSFGSAEKTSMARIIFCISSLDAIDTDAHSDGKEYNISYDKGPSKASLTDKFREKYYYREKDVSVPNYTNPVKVSSTFKFRGFDYIVGIGCGIFFTVIMCMVLAVFIGRIFDVIVLVIIQPFFVGMMPFDDGEYYKRWFELFLGKLFQGFGSVIAMRLYLMILEQLFSGTIRFSNSNSVGARLQDYLMMLLFAMGGGVAVRHIGPLVTGILSQAAATGEQMNAYEGLKVGNAIAGKELGVVKSFLTADASRVGKLAGGTANLTGQAAGMLAGRFMGKRGAASGGSAGGAGGGGGDSSEPGTFGNKARPEGSQPEGFLGGSSSKAVSQTQQALSSFKAGGALDRGGAANGKGAGSRGGTGSSGGAGDKGGMSSSGGQSMQDIMGGSSDDFMSTGFNFEADELSQGGFTGSRASSSSSASSSQPSSPSYSGSNGGGQSMQDIVGSGSGGSVSSASIDPASGASLGSSGFGQSMQDIVGSGSGGSVSSASIDPASGASGSFTSSAPGGFTNSASDSSISSGSGFGSDPAYQGGLMEGSDPAVSGGSSYIAGSDPAVSGGGSQSMQDLVSNTAQNGFDAAGGTFEDPLNKGFYMDKGDEDDE